MKDDFKEFYNLEESVLEGVWEDDKTLFVFDANVLLNLYGYAKQTRDDFFSILQIISDKLWIPYHVGLEYQRRRLSVIRNEKVVFNDIEKNLEKIQNVFKGDFEKLALKRRFPRLFENTEKLEKEINKSISNYRKSVQYWDGAQPCVRSHDEIRDKLNHLFEGRVGCKPESQKWLDNLYKEGEERFEKKVPPGFRDEEKGSSDDESVFCHEGFFYERKYGDLILWKQLIAKAKSEKVENLIFVTDDSKDDWWYKINSNGKKTIGPLAELQSEIYRESGVKNFHMYSTSMFLEDGKENLAVDVSESSIEDASTPHVVEVSSERTSKRIPDFEDPFMPPTTIDERLRDLVNKKNGVSAIDDGQLREILRISNDASFIGDDRWSEVLGRARRILPFDDDRLREILDRNNKVSLGNDRLKEVLNKINSLNSVDYNSLKDVVERRDSFGQNNNDDES